MNSGEEAQENKKTQGRARPQVPFLAGGKDHHAFRRLAKKTCFVRLTAQFCNIFRLRFQVILCKKMVTVKEIGPHHYKEQVQISNTARFQSFWSKTQKCNSYIFGDVLLNLQVDEVFVQGVGTDEQGGFKYEDVVRLLKYGEFTSKWTD